MDSKYAQSTKLAPCDDIVELEDTSLHLVDVVQSAEGETQIFKWTIANYYRLRKSYFYASHHIRIGNTFHRLRIIKYDPKLHVIIRKRGIMLYLLIGLTPEPIPEVRVGFVILVGRNFEVLPVNCLKNVLRHIPYRECYFEFLDSMPTDSPHLVVLCKIFVTKNDFVRNAHKQTDPTCIDLEIVKPKGILNDLEIMLNEDIFADIVIEVAGREFRTHQAILGARSLVFKSIFRNEMKKSESRLVIDNVNAETFGEFLRYVYTGKMKCLTPDLAEELLSLADKYDVQDLKLEVGEYLACNLSIEQVLRTALLAELYNEDMLKYETTAFIAKNLKSVMKIPDWSIFKNHVDMVEEVLKCLTYRTKKITQVFYKCSLDVK